MDGSLEMLKMLEAQSESRMVCLFFFQAEDGIRDVAVTGVQTCALPISFTCKPSRKSCAPASQKRLRAKSRKSHSNTSRRSRAKRSEEHTSELQSRLHLVCRLLLEKKKKNKATSLPHQQLNTLVILRTDH